MFGSTITCTIGSLGLSDNPQSLCSDQDFEFPKLILELYQNDEEMLM